MEGREERKIGWCDLGGVCFLAGASIPMGQGGTRRPPIFGLGALSRMSPPIFLE